MIGTTFSAGDSGDSHRQLAIGKILVAADATMGPETEHYCRTKISLRQKRRLASNPDFVMKVAFSSMYLFVNAFI